MMLLFVFGSFLSGVRAQSVSGARGVSSKLELQQALGFRNLAVDSVRGEVRSVVDTSLLTTKIKSPLVAVLLSVIPGGGQIYNGSYWKVPIIWGAQAFFITQWIYNNKQYQSYRSQFSDSLTSGPPFAQSSPTRQYYLEGLETLRDAYVNQRDSYAWYMAGVYVLSMLDAYVDAELSGFNVSPSLSNTPAGPAVAVNLNVRF